MRGDGTEHDDTLGETTDEVVLLDFEVPLPLDFEALPLDFEVVPLDEADLDTYHDILEQAEAGL